MFIGYKPGGRKWILTDEAVKYYVDWPGELVGHKFLELADGYLLIYKGYSWDGGSGPALDTANVMGASLVHDAGYQLGRMGILAMKSRRKVDRIMRKIMLEDGVTKLRAAWWYAAVRFGARQSFKKEK